MFSEELREAVKKKNWEKAVRLTAWIDPNQPLVINVVRWIPDPVLEIKHRGDHGRGTKELGDQKLSSSKS